MYDTIEQALADLPDAPHDIAMFLVVRGHFGRRSSSCDCPVANFLRAETSFRNTTVGMISAHTNEDSSLFEPVYLTEGAKAFIVMFDNLLFPQLIRQ